MAMVNVYTVKDVQRELKCGKTYAYELMNSKIFPSFKLNSRLYVTEEEFCRFLKSCKNRKIKL